jgi:hypothetical protein
MSGFDGGIGGLRKSNDNAASQHQSYALIDEALGKLCIKA